MEETVTTILERHRGALETAAALGEGVRADTTALRLGEADVLRLVLQQILPAMQHIDHPVLAAARRQGGPESARGWVYIHLGERAIVLAGGLEEEAGDRGGEGVCCGTDLVFTRSGRLLLREFAGSWSDWAGTPAGWDSGTVDNEAGVVREGATWLCSAGQALRHYSLERIVGGIDREIQQAITERRLERRLLDGSLATLTRITAALEG